MPDDPTQDVNAVAPTKKEKVLGALGHVVAAADPTGRTNTNSLDVQIQNAQQRRLDEARMHRKNIATYGAILHTGKNPKTGADLTPEEEQMYENWKKASIAAYEKAAGIDPETKKQVKRGIAITEHIINLGRRNRQGQQQGGAAGTGAQPGGLPPPPQASAGAAPDTTATGPAMSEKTPIGGSSTQLPPPPKAYDPYSGTVDAQDVADQHALGLYDKQQAILSKYKIAEEQAKQKAIAAAKAENPTGRPVMGPALSVRNAKTLAAQGKTYLDQDGDPIDLSALPDSMGLKFIAWGGKHYYVPFSPNSKVVTVGNETYAISPMDVEALTQGAGTDVGQHTMPSTSATTDPSTNQTTITKRTPTTTGAAGRGSPAEPAAAAPQNQGKPSQRLTAAPKTGKSAPSEIPLDTEGHISAGWTGAAPQVIEGANQLKDGMDLKDIGGTAKSKPLSEALARKAFGWSRDKFTPLEHQQVALASRYIKEAIESPSVKSLDADFFSQLPMIGATADTAKEGNIAKALTKLAAISTTPQQAEFLRLYRQMAGTISGLGRLSRGGRITEATVNRLLSELPNPTNTRNSKDAIARLTRLQDEIDTALSHDSYESLTIGRAPSKASSAILKPPPKSGASSSIDDEIMKAAKEAAGVGAR